MTQQLQLIGISPEELQHAIVKGVKTHLDELQANFQPKEPTALLSRKATAELLDINLSTLHKWTKQGKLQSYGKGGRVWYKRNEIEESLIPVKY